MRQLADYISHNCPDIKGFSDKNLWRMKQFYETYAEDAEKLSPLVRQISWTNNCIILSRAKSIKEKEFYLTLCVQDRLSKRQLDRHIDAALYERTQVSPPKLSPLLREIAPEAERVFRDQYVMEFITGKEAKPENTLRRALLKKMKQCIPNGISDKMHGVLLPLSTPSSHTSKDRQGKTHTLQYLECHLQGIGLPAW